MEHTVPTSTQPYDPDHLLASLIGKLNLKNDAALARAVSVAAGNQQDPPSSSAGHRIVADTYA